MPNMPLPYTIDDMVNDAVSLLDRLEHEQVHLVGASMGGVIAQLLTIKHPDRVKSLTTIMTSSGDPNLPRPLPQAIALLTQPASKNRAEYIEKTIAGWRALQGSAYPLNEEVARQRAGHFYDRSYEPDGAIRQLAAIASLGSLKPGLNSLTLPTLVIHGDEDPLFPIECGRDIATSVPGAKMLVLTGVGHALPPPVWPHVMDAIANHTT
jgi:pimeloyl-ACP methyl ester carboxylesterase